MEHRSILHAPPDHLSAVILCENAVLAAAPLQTIQSLTSRFCGELEIQASVWQFEALANPAIEAAAIKSANAAALIGIAASAQSELPPVVRTVLTQALSARLALPTAVMLFLRRDREAGEDYNPNSAASYLRQLARQAGAAFFTTEISGTPLTRPREATESIPFASMTDPWDHHSPGPRHWGLNE